MKAILYLALVLSAPSFATPFHRDYGYLFVKGELQPVSFTRNAKGEYITVDWMGDKDIGKDATCWSEGTEPMSTVPNCSAQIWLDKHPEPNTWGRGYIFLKDYPAGPFIPVKNPRNCATRKPTYTEPMTIDAPVGHIPGATHSNPVIMPGKK